MEKIRLGRTEMEVSRLGFGGIPIQRISEEEAIAVVRRCLELGITFIDTAMVILQVKSALVKQSQAEESSLSLLQSLGTELVKE